MEEKVSLVPRVQKRGLTGETPPPAQTEHHFLIADLFPDAGTSLFDERTHRPVHRAVADVINEILQNLFSARRVRDFGVKLQPVKLALWIFHRGEVGALPSPATPKSFRPHRHFIAMTFHC